MYVLSMVNKFALTVAGEGEEEDPVFEDGDGETAAAVGDEVDPQSLELMECYTNANGTKKITCPIATKSCKAVYGKRV